MSVRKVFVYDVATHTVVFRRRRRQPCDMVELAMLPVGFYVFISRTFFSKLARGYMIRLDSDIRWPRIIRVRPYAEYVGRSAEVADGTSDVLPRDQL